MEADAKAYNCLNKPQYDVGCDFIHSLKISEGDKVLDMGCGTGDITNFIASLVGPHGEVVGVDPDEARIKIAQEKFKDIKNLHFIVADSSSGFTHEDEEYYDLHLGNSVIHWCIGNRKQAYLEKAYGCLKPGGRLAFLTLSTPGFVPVTDKEDYLMEHCSEDAYKKLCEDALFRNIFTEIATSSAWFPNFEVFKSWFRATYHRDMTYFDPGWVQSYLDKYITTTADGGVVRTFDGILRLTAEKRKSS